VQLAVAPVDWLLMVTTVPIGSVRWAHVPGGAASYHVAPPLWLRPLGAGAAEDDGAGADLAAGFGAGFGAGFVVVVAGRTAAFCTGFTVVRVVAVRAARTAVVGVVVSGTVVGTSVVGTESSERLTRLSAGRSAAPPSPTETDSAPDADAGRTANASGGGDACNSVSKGAAAIAAHSAMGTARRAFLDPRVVRTFPSCENAGAARPRLVLKRTQRRLKTSGEPTEGPPATAKPESAPLFEAERQGGIRPRRSLNLVDIEVFCRRNRLPHDGYPRGAVGLTTVRDGRQEGGVGFHKQSF
jgi:hypothetical protein